MSRPLAVFTPSLSPPEDLERIFVAREGVLEDVIDRVERAATSDERNHTLLVGPRGAGKTHLVALAHHRAGLLRDQKGLRFLRSWLPEDPWGVTSYERLLRELLEHLDLPAADEPPSHDVEHLELAVELIAAEHGPLVVFVENLDQTLAAIGSTGQGRLRRLAQAGHLLLVATTTSITRDLHSEAQPFFGFFTTTRLKPLTVDEAAQMLEKIAATADEKGLAAVLAQDRSNVRLRVVEHLAGGQPRVWALLVSALGAETGADLADLLVRRVDELTPYYQSELGRLSSQQRQVVLVLADADRPLTVKSIAERCSVDQRSLGRTMVDLRAREWVVELDSSLLGLVDGRLTYYELGEPLARLALQVKSARGGPVPMVVEFLARWFQPGELTWRSWGEHPYADAVRAKVRDDAVMGVVRSLGGAPPARDCLPVLAGIDEALQGLADGDATQALDLPSSLRRLLERDVDALGVTAARVRVHIAALREQEERLATSSHDWLRRARDVVGRAAAGSDDLVDALAIVSRWLEVDGDLDGARTAAEEVLRRSPDGRMTLWARNSITMLTRRLAPPSEVVSAFRDLLEHCERELGGDDEDTLMVRNNLALAVQSTGDTARAARDLERLVGDAERALGVAHPTSSFFVLNLAYTYAAAGRHADVDALLRTAVERRGQVAGLDDALLGELEETRRVLASLR